MGLPKLSRPEYSTTIPSNGKKIKYSPFSVKEEKTLVLASETEDPEEIANAVVNVLQNCITSPSDLDVASLALFDIEYLFLKARAKSVGEKISVVITDPQDPTCTANHDINIDKIGIKKTEGHTTLVDIDDDVKIQMKYPGIEFFTEGIVVNNIISTISLISKCVSSIITEDEVFESTDMSAGELDEWIEGLTSAQFKKVTDFFVTMPKLSHTINATNPKTKNTFTIHLEGLADFF